MKRLALSVLVLAVISGSANADWIHAPEGWNSAPGGACGKLVIADKVMWDARQTLVETDKVLPVSHSEQTDDFNTRSSALYEAILQYRIAIRKFGDSIGCGGSK